MENGFEELKKKLAQKKASIQMKEKWLKERERKIRTRRLIELGGLIVKAKMDHLNNNTLLGAILELKAKALEETILKTWTDRGAKEFEKRQKGSNKVIVTFGKEPERELKAILRDLKLRWNPFRSEWQGYADPKKVKQLLGKKEAKIEVIMS